MARQLLDETLPLLADPPGDPDTQPDDGGGTGKTGRDEEVDPKQKK